MSSTLQAGRRRALGSIAVLGAALVWGATVGPGVAMAQTPSDGAVDRRTVSVTGSGTAEVVPDIARISVGVATRGREATEASSRAAAQMQAVIDALVGAGVAEEDIQTSRIDLDPIRRRDRSGEGTRAIIGWQASNRVSATVRDIDATGEVIDAAIAAGATDLGNIAFRKEDPSAAEAEARLAAVDEAASIAGQLASAAGVEIDRRLGHRGRRQRRRLPPGPCRVMGRVRPAPGGHPRPPRHHHGHRHRLHQLRDRLSVP